MQRTAVTRRRGLSRDTIVARALKLGETEGLEAVSLRRLASDFEVTPMALYRHVKDKQDLINAMAEKVIDGFDLTAGFRPSMTWSDRMRRALTNFKDQMDARPMALPLSIAYSGENPIGFWRMVDDLLGVTLEARFTRREAIVVIRVVSNLVTGYLALFRQARQATERTPSAREVDLFRRRLELNILSLPPDDFPNVVEGASELADVWLSDPSRWWTETVDLIVFGLERLAEKRVRKPRRKTS